MSERRYQLWMRLMFHHPGNAAETRTQGRANFAWRIIDTQAADFRAQQSAVLGDGYSLYGQSDDPADVENFALEMQEGQQ